MKRLGEAGQLIVAVMLLLVLMATMVPLMVLYTQREAKWTAKQDQTTTAFHLAEAGVEKAYRALSLSTATWYSLVEDGTPVPNFNFNSEFTDLKNGSYTVAITSGPEDRQATVWSVGKDKRKGEVRALKVVFGQNILGDTAVQSLDGITLGGKNIDVHWGAVIGNEHIDTGGRDYPQYWSASSLDVDTDPGPENTDGCQWHSFSGDVPPDPGIDEKFYRSSAQATGFYYDSDQSWSTLVVTSGVVVFVEGNLTLGSPGININGTLYVTGNVTTTAGTWGKGDPDMTVPPTAWKQYCNDWDAYDFADPTKPAEFPGLDSDYEASGLTPLYNPVQSKTAVTGFMYVGGNFSTGGGGGNTRIYGVMFVEGSVAMNGASSITIYYNKTAAEAVKTTRLVLVRKSWQAVLHPWPL